MTTETFLTDHQVDNDVAFRDESFRQFINRFPIPLDWDVRPDGNSIIYSFGTMEEAAAMERLAKRIIEEHSLPLEANTEVWTRNGHTFEVNLEIKY